MPAVVRSANVWWVLLVGTLVAALAVIGTLQYRWLGELSAAEEQRLRGALDAGTRHIAEDTDHEIARVIGTFRDSTAQAEDLARRLRTWTASAHDARLLKSIHVARGRGSNVPDLAVLVIAPDSARLQDVSWPVELAPIETVLIVPPQQRPRRVPQVMQTIPALCVPARDEEPPPPPPQGERRPPPPDGEFGGGPPPPPRGPRALMILQLDRAYLAEGLVPDLAKRYLSPRDFDIAVVNGTTVLYRSDDAWPRDASAAAETSASFLRLNAEESGTPWRLLVRRRGAALADMVAATRRRNLAVGFAVLLLLASSVVLVIVLARRAERLRMQQLAFVAGITHELNTPIAAVSSAAQNLADGIISEPAQVVRYGGMIANEARRLADTVSQVLDFAGLQARNVAPERALVDIGSLVDEAVAQCRWLAQEHGVTIDTNIAGDLPLVDGDAIALTRAVQNLIANAIRHGGGGQWVGVTAARDDGAVILRVEDRGPGVAARDLPHLFEPFYRGRDAARVRGSGLGLAIVQQIAALHGGRITVERRRERGASFVLRLPMSEVAQHG